MSHMSNLDCDIQAGVVDDRRIGVLMVSPAVFGSFVKGGLHRCILNDVPDGCTVRQVQYDANRQAFVVVIQSDKFDVVPEGCLAPTLVGPVIIGPRCGETEELFVVRSRAEPEGGVTS